MPNNLSAVDRRLRGGTVLVLALLMLFDGQTTSAADSPREEVLAGVASFGGLAFAPLDCSKQALQPLAWASRRASGQDPLGLLGSQPVCGWLGNSGRGRIAALSLGTALFRAKQSQAAGNSALRRNLLGWLLQDGRRLACSSGHGELITADGLAQDLQGWLSEQQIVAEDMTGTLTAEALRRCDCLMVGDATAALSPEEVSAVQTWVEGGGSLLLLGYGPAWRHQQSKFQPLPEYPLNPLARAFGLQFSLGRVIDPAAANGKQARPDFSVQPLTDYCPAPLVILKAGRDDVDSVKQRASQQPQCSYVVEGQHMGLLLPSADWQRLDSPGSMIALLDQAYETELALNGGVRPAYGGSMIWYVPADDPLGTYAMYCGNTIVYKTKVAHKITEGFNAGYPYWAILHEQGHNMVNTACNNLFVYSGRGPKESWANVYAAWAADQNGWPDPPEQYATGLAYHNQPQPDFHELTSERLILFGCLKLVWERYGWDGMQRFMTQAASDAAAGAHYESDAQATAYFVEQLSAAYGVDFAALIAHWGFPVTDTSKALTSRYPPAEISWPPVRSD